MTLSDAFGQRPIFRKWRSLGMVTPMSRVKNGQSTVSLELGSGKKYLSHKKKYMYLIYFKCAYSSKRHVLKKFLHK
jgi:hypothetical protein